MIDFKDKTYAKILAAMLAAVSDDVDKREESLINTALGPAAYALESPFANQEDMGVIITADQHTIKTALLEGVASYTASDVAKARLNGEVEISVFDVKAASGNTATIAYTVTPSQTALITQIELLSADGSVLEQASVYVPIAEAVQITHRIPVKEGNT